MKPPTPRRTSRVAAMLLVLALLGGCSRSGSDPSGGKPGAGGPRAGADRPAPVTVADVTRKTVPFELRTFGTVEPNVTVAVRSQTAGELIGVHFQKGQDVKKGDLLFTIDARPAKAAKQMAEANLARDEVQYRNAQKEAARQKDLADQKLVSKEQYDQALTASDALAATVQADEAAIESARLQLEYSSIKSPIDGRTGDLMVNVGNLVKANDVPLVTINQVKPIQVSFSLPQRELPRIMAQMAAAAAGIAAKPPVQALIPGEEDRPENGEVFLVDNSVDRTTGTIKLWALFANGASRLWPGQLVNAVLKLGVQKDAIAVPSQALQTGQKGTYVFVVKPDGTVEDRIITVDRAYGEDTIIAKGLQAGERVVTDGQLQLMPGSKIAIKPAPKDGAARP